MADGNPNPGNQDFPTILGPDAQFKGELSFEKGLRVMGRFEGSVKSPGRLHVAREAKMQADVEAGGIIVEGEMRGNLKADDKVELKSSARYEGDLTASKLVVEEGAVFVGQVSVGTDKKPGQPGGAADMNRPNPQQQGGPQGQPQGNPQGQPQKK